jgi:PKD repeat protein
MEQETQTANNQQRIWLIVGGVVVVILIVVGILLLINMFSGNNEEGSAQVEPNITINQPAQGAILDIANLVTVSGTGEGLPEGNVVVQAIDRDGNVLTQQPTTIDAPDAGTGGQGPWSVQLNIETEPGIAGRIRAYSPSPADDSVMAEAVVEVSFGRTATAEPFIQINEPVQGAVVDIANPVTVNGVGAGLPEGNVVVQAIDRDGNILTQQPTIIDAPDAGTGVQGPWSVQLTIETEPGMAGQIRAFSPSPTDNSAVADTAIKVTFGQAEGPNPPTAQINGPTQGQTGQILTFDGSGSSGETAIVDYTWDFGDGTGATGRQVNQEYNEPGSYNVSLTITDEQGLQGRSSLAIQIYPVVEVPDLPDLEGKDWSLVEAATFDTLPITAFFQGGVVSGFSGCNTYTGSYQSDGAGLTISGIITTQLICDEAATNRESTYLFNLGSVNGYVVQGKQLSLTGPQPMTFMEQ